MAINYAAIKRDLQKYEAETSKNKAINICPKCLRPIYAKDFLEHLQNCEAVKL